MYLMVLPGIPDGVGVPNGVGIGARPILIFECRCRLFSEKNYDYDLIGRLKTKQKKAYKT